MGKHLAIPVLICVYVCVCVFSVLGIKPRVSCTVGKWYTIDSCPHE
jgi:hypothetical protein